MQVDVSLLTSTNSSARWSLKSGFGLLFGISFNSFTDISLSEWHDVSGLNSYFSESERFRNKNYFTSSIYLPFMVDFRIANNSDFWKRVHVFYEARPMFQLSFIPETNTLTQLGFSQGLGLKIEW
jgi:hypothetical protein